MIQNLCSLGVLFSLLSCTDTENNPSNTQQEFEKPQEMNTEIIAAHSPENIHKDEAISVLFTRDIFEDIASAPTSSGFFQITPKIEGEPRWISKREIHFVPKEPLKQGETFKITLNLSSIIKETKEKNPEFLVSVKAQKFWFSHQEFHINDSGKGSVDGVINTTYPVSEDVLHKMLEAKQNGTTNPIQWTAQSETEHKFSIQGISRQQEESNLQLIFSGKPINIDETYTRNITIPAKNQLSLLSITPNNNENAIELRFSDTITSTEKELKKSIQVAQHKDIRITIDQNMVRIFSNKAPWSGPLEVTVSAGIQGENNIKLPISKNYAVHFGEQLPSVSFGSNGVIYPTSTDLSIPIEVVNLRAINVEVLQIFDSNMGQFLQVNDMDGTDQLKRVGRTVINKTISIEQKADRQNRTTRLGLDMSDLITQNPNGLYRVNLSFSKGDISYPCPTELPNPKIGDQPIAFDWENQSESSYWDDYYDYDMDYYEYQREKKNPCSDVFYGTGNSAKYSVSRNVMISDIGIIAKKGENDTIHVTVTDIKNTNPIKGNIKLLDYQLQEIGSALLDENGMASIAYTQKPFAIMATTLDGMDQGWLKLKANSSLSVSHFDTSGAQNNKGIKGFIYGERGVWRPGDDIYLGFMLHDSEKQLPSNHPVLFQLIDPQGNIADSRTITKDTNGLYTLKTGTSYNDLSGSYTAKFTVGGSTFSKKLKIENVLPNRLDIKMDFPKEILTDTNIEASLASQWLHGGSAAGFTYDVSVEFSSGTTSFERYADYSFQNNITALTFTEPQTLQRNSLNEEGKAIISATLIPPEEAPGFINAKFSTRVYEPSGAFSIDQYSIPYAPFEAFIGIKTPKGDAARGMLLTDTKHKVDIVAVDPEGNPISRNVSMSLYKVNWRWWWEKGEDNMGDYIANNAHDSIAHGDVSIQNGKGSWEFEVKYPDWGRYLLVAKDRDTKGHISTKTVYIDWPGWAGRAQSENPGGASVLSVSTEKPKYNVGDDITINIPSGETGRILVSLENGTKVLHQEWVTPQKETTKYSFKATKEMAPNIYAHVTLLQPHNKSGNDLPIRLYGIAPIEIADPTTELTPEIATTDTFEPESTVTVEISEKQDKAMTYTLAIVDEGLLQLTRYNTPNPWGEFYKKESLGVRSWDNYSDIAGAYGMALEDQISIGGDGSGSRDGGEKANRFPPMVDFQGPFVLAAGETHKRNVQIGSYIGKVRVMVVAGQNGAFGSSEKSVTVKKPLMVLGTMPRILRPQEELALPISVFALDESIQSGEISVAVEGPIELASDAKQKIKFDKRDKMVYFKLKVKNELGIAKVRIQASSGKHKANQDIEINVLPTSGDIYSLVGNNTILEKDMSWSQNFASIGMNGTNSGTLEVSRIPPMELEKHLTQLIRYPHGCIEQTTSSVFPQLYLSSLATLSSEKSSVVQKNINAGIERIQSFQLSSGGLGYWPGASETSPWGTNYAGHFLIEAEKAGFFVPPSLRNNLINYQITQANTWNDVGNTEFDEQAYRLYMLALAGSPQMGAMNRLRAKDLNTTAKWRLAMTYQLAGQQQAAEDLTQNISIDVPQYTDLSGNFGSTLRDQAMILEAMIVMNHPKTEEMLQTVSKGISQAQYPSTQTMAYALIAMAKSANLDGSKPFSFSYTFNGKKETVSSDKPIFSTPLTITDSNTVLLSDAPFSLYPRVILSGIPALGQEKTESNKLSLKVEYLSTVVVESDGNVETQYNPISSTNIKQGTDFVARITIANPSGRDLEELALTQLIPSGWEIYNEDSGVGRDFEYRDVKDERVDTYFDIKKGTNIVLDLKLHASYAGRFYLPLVSVEAMYDPTIFAREKGMWITVRSENEEG